MASRLECHDQFESSAQLKLAILGVADRVGGPDRIHLTGFWPALLRAWI